MNKNLVVVFFLLFAFTGRSQSTYQFTSKALVALGSEEREMFLLKESEGFLVFKINHDFYGMNSKQFDLFLMNKLNDSVKLILSLDTMMEEQMEVDSIGLTADSLRIFGSLFDKLAGKRYNFIRRLVNGNLVEMSYLPFGFKAGVKPTYRYFEKFECLGSIGDSAYFFADYPVYSTITPNIKIGLFATRSIYSYDYLQKRLKQIPIPALQDTSLEKVYEEISFKKGHPEIVGLFHDKKEINTVVSGVYTVDLEQHTIAIKPIEQNLKGGLMPKGVNSKLSGNIYHFEMETYHSIVFELEHSGSLVVGLNATQPLWARLVKNKCINGPYPNQIKQQSGTLMLVYGKKGGIINVPSDDLKKIYSCNLVFVDSMGTINYLKGPKLNGNILLYTNTLMNWNTTQFALFYLDMKDKKLKRYTFSMR